MINKDSIVTAYDEHLTLVEWLQKVETALKDAVLTGVTINKKGNATLSFVFTFEDGTTLETDDLILQQGESVQTATIRNGHLILTLTNGDELDAGDLGGVNGFSIDASQHLIVTYQNGTTQDLGAIFNGNVVINGSVSTPILTSANDHIEAQKPVIEVMTGYSATPLSSFLNDYNGVIAYAGVVKNGNKLTFAVSGSFRKTSTSTSVPGVINFTIPNSIYTRLIPISVGEYSYLDQKKVTVFKNPYSGVDLPFRFSRYGSNSVQVSFTPDAMENDVTYVFRYEVTFLLSDNLVA